MFKTIPLTASAACAVALALLGFNPSPSLAADAYTENPGTEGDGNFTVGPEYTVAPDLTDLGNPKGKSFEFAMPLADSKIFKGDDSTLNPQKPIKKRKRSPYFSSNG
jgi:iron(III)-enterobactin esterase